MNHGGHGEHGELREANELLVDPVLTAATKVHRVLGRGLLESVYEAALALELSTIGIQFDRQVEIPVIYESQLLGVGFRADMIVDDCLLLELKSVEDFAPIHIATVINYLKLLKFKRGFLLNFNKPRMKDGIKRISI